MNAKWHRFATWIDEEGKEVSRWIDLNSEAEKTVKAGEESREQLRDERKTAAERQAERRIYGSSY